MTSGQISTTRLVGAVTLTPALPGDLHAILDLVRAVHLPPEGIAETIAYFWVAREGERIIGTVGLEVYDDRGHRLRRRTRRQVPHLLHRL